MALGTPIAATVYYSSNNGTSVSPAYPSNIAATDVVLLFLGQKPSTANGGTATTPTGWTLRAEITGAGGYDTTLGADTGNTNLRIYSWDAPVAGQTGLRSVILGENNISWAFIVRIPTDGGTPEFGSADGSRTTAPTAGTPFTVDLTNGASATDFEAGDIAIWAMCIPTDVTTPNQFSNSSVTATGATFATAVELREPDSATGNDIGGYSAYASVSSGSSTAAPSVTVTAGGTVTNVRGPVLMLRVREGAAPQDLTPSRYDNTNTFYTPTITQTFPAQTLTPDLYTNTNVFYTPDITQAGGAQTLTPALYTNTNVFYAATVTATRTLTPDLYTNTNVFYAATVTSTRNLEPALYTNTSVFYSATVSAGGSDIAPALYNNTNVFYSPVVATGASVIAPDLYTNNNAIYAVTASAQNTITTNLFANSSIIYGGTVTASASVTPSLFSNQSAIYSPTITATAYTLTFLDYVSSGYVDANYIGLAVQNTSVFFEAALLYDQSLSPALVQNSNAFFVPTVAKIGQPIQLAGFKKRRPFRPSQLFQFEDKSFDAIAEIKPLDIKLYVYRPSASGEIIIPGRASIGAQTITSRFSAATAFSSWNDPTDDEMMAIMELLL